MTTTHAIARRALCGTAGTCWAAAVITVVGCTAAGAHLQAGHLLLGAAILMQATSAAVLAQLIPSSEAIAGRAYLRAVEDSRIRDLH